MRFVVSGGLGREGKVLLLVVYVTPDGWNDDMCRKEHKFVCSQRICQNLKDDTSPADGKNVPISCNIKHTQFDRAVIQKTSGLGGALCTMCPATRHELLYYLFSIICHNLKGFEPWVPRNLESINLCWA